MELQDHHRRIINKIGITRNPAQARKLEPLEEAELKFNVRAYRGNLQQKNMLSEAEAGVSVLGDGTCDGKVDFRDFAVMARSRLVVVE